MSVEPMYTVAEIAAAWVVSKNHIYGLINTGVLEAVNIGHGRAKTRVPESALDAYLGRLKEQARRSRTRNIRGHLQAVA